MIKKGKSFWGIVSVLISICLLGACSSSSIESDSGDTTNKLKVVVTNSIISDITENIAGDRIELHSIVPIGKDPHEYEPLPVDVQKASESDIIFYNGINLETGGNAWFTKLVNNANKKENEEIGRAHV